MTMKFTDVLRGYVPLDEERIKAVWADAHFCLDTQILLDVYRYTPENRVAFLKLLGALKGRLFVPNRVAVEFARNRLTAIRGHFGPQRIIRLKLDEALKDIKAKHPKHQLLEQLGALVEQAKKLVDDQYGEAERKHLALIDDDTILRELLSVIGDAVGDPYPEDEAQREYKRRKDGNVPPFCKVDDDKDEDRRKGDVVIWLELLKQYEGQKRPLIFVTDDMKENWWQKCDGGRHGPQPALVQEAYQRAQADILFYTAERFSETAPSRLGVQVPQGLAEETKEIREQQRHAQQEREMSLPPARQTGSLGWLDNSAEVAAGLIVTNNEAWRRRQMEAAAAMHAMHSIHSQDEAAWIAFQDTLRRQAEWESAAARRTMSTSQRPLNQGSASASPTSSQSPSPRSQDP
jgi:hypothetical protein